MKICVTGYNGRLGNELVSRYGLIPMDCDLSRKDSTSNFIRKHNPDVIIHCAGKTDVDWCEKNLKMAYMNNVGSLFYIKEYFTGHLIHLSTDFVFDGRDGPYDELDDINPINVYGRTKYAAELLLSKRQKTTIVRTTVLYGSHKKTDFVKYLVNNIQNTSENIPLSDKYFTTPTYIPHLANAIMDLTNIPDYGIINIVGRDFVSRYDFGLKICDIFGLDSNRLIKKTFPWNVARRPMRAGLKLNLADSYGIKTYTLEDGLNDYRDNWK